MSSVSWKRVGPFAAAAAGLTLAGASVLAADHSEAPSAAADQPADLADVYAWHSGDKLYAAITFAGARMPEAEQTGTYDAGVLYTVHLDNSGDNQSDIDVLVRFGQNRAGEWGVQVESLPGADGAVIGPVEEMVADTSGLRVFAGLRDDPFFFDLQGFSETLDTGSLQFASLSTGARDSLAGTNATAIVLEMDLAAARGAGSNIRLWATTARK